MDISFALSSAVICSAGSVLKGGRIRTGRSSCILDNGVILSVAGKADSAEAERSVKESPADGFELGAAASSADSVKVSLMRSSRSRVRQALKNVSTGFELPMIRRAAAASGFLALLSSVLFLGPAPAQAAETLPSCVDAAVHSINDGQGLMLAGTSQNPFNHVLKSGRKFTSFGGHGNSPGTHINNSSGKAVHVNIAHTNIPYQDVAGINHSNTTPHANSQYVDKV